MITELHLINFRGFEDHTIPFRPLTIVVGRNNAGKSTIVEALRLISLVVSRFQGRLDRIPRLWKLPKDSKGRDRYKNLDINLQSIFFTATAILPLGFAHDLRLGKSSRYESITTKLSDRAIGRVQSMVLRLG